jgi:hypothetical protein
VQPVQMALATVSNVDGGADRENSERYRRIGEHPHWNLGQERRGNEAFAMMLATQETMDPAISRLGGTSSPRRAQVLLKARRERAAETDQRVRERVVQSGSGGESGGGDVATSVLGDETLDLGSNTQGGDGDGDGGTKKAKRGKRKRKGKRQRGEEKRAVKMKLGNGDGLEHS